MPTCARTNCCATGPGTDRRVARAHETVHLNRLGAPGEERLSHFAEEVDAKGAANQRRPDIVLYAQWSPCDSVIEWKRSSV